MAGAFKPQAFPRTAVVTSTPLPDDLVTEAELVAEISSAFSAHGAALDPHPQYVLEVNAASYAPVQSVAGKTGVVLLVKADVGLDSVDNTADLAKPVSTAAQTALDDKVDKVAGKDLSTEDYSSAEKAKLAGIESGAQVNTVVSVAGKTGAVTLVKADVGLGSVDNTADLAKPISSATQTALDGKVDKVIGKGLSTEDYSTAEKSKLAGIAAGAQVNTVNSVAGKTGTVTLVKADVGLSSVDNTADLAKPISTATQTALDGKAASVHSHTVSQLSDASADARTFLQAANYAAMRTALSLGSAALKNIGTSGDAVPLLNTSNTWSLPQVIDIDSSSTALRITQVGSGHCLVVEDDANPDASAFIIDNAGRVSIGGPNAMGPPFSYPLQVNTLGSAGCVLGQFGSSGGAATQVFIRSRNSTASAFGSAVIGTDILGYLRFYGDDGSVGQEAVRITAAVDNSVASGSVAGRLLLSTTPAGGSTPVSRFQINNSGQIAIGGDTAAVNFGLKLSAALSGNIAVNGYRCQSTIQSDVTSAAIIFQSFPATQAASFTLTNLRHFAVTQGAIGAGSTISNQLGFYVDANCTGATFNYGYFGNIPAGTNRWNLYMAGTALNYAKGALLLDTLVHDGVSLLQANGNIAFKPAASVTPANNGELTFELTSNTLLTVKVKGSDGVVRSATLVLA